MIYKYQGRKYSKSSTVFTPSPVAKFLKDILAPVVQPKVVLDPAVGTGRLLDPWYDQSMLIGIDIKNQGAQCDHFREYPYDLLTTWSLPYPDLIVCNPPFNGAGVGNRQMMMPEQFLRTSHNLFGNVPFVLFAPHTFRLNQRCFSSRRNWLMADDAPEITSIISLPLDVFPDIKFHVEILIFNVPNLCPHYWY